VPERENLRIRFSLESTSSGNWKLVAGRAARESIARQLREASLAVESGDATGFDGPDSRRCPGCSPVRDAVFDAMRGALESVQI